MRVSIMRTHMKLKSSLLLALSITPSLTFAALGPIVVTATKFEQPIEKSAIAVEIITAEQIKNTVALDVADIIKYHSGIDIARNGDNGKVTSVFMRGSESNHTVILIDGIKINPATIGGAALQNISPDLIDRIEIIKGPRSSLYGSEAIGGVINIIMRKNTKGLTANIQLGAGDDGALKTVVSINKGGDNFQTGISFSGFSTDGFPVTDDSTEDHGYERKSINAFVDYTVGNQTFKLSHWNADGNVEYYSFGDLDQDYKNNSSAFVWQSHINKALNTHLRYSIINDDIDQNQANFLSQFDFAKTQRKELELQLNYLINEQVTVSVGAVNANEKVDALSFGTSIDSETDIKSYYGLLQFNQDIHNLAITTRNTSHDDFGSNNTWNVDYKINFSRALSVHATTGTAFRAPDATDRFGFGGNVDLDAEKSKSAEIGLSLKLSEQAEFNINFYKTNIRDLITYNGTNNQNIANAKITGTELQIKSNSPHWFYQFSAVLQSPRDEDNDVILSRRAETALKANIQYKTNKWNVGTQISMIGPRDNSGFDTIELEAYNLIHLNTSYQLAKHYTVSLKIENIQDVDYQTANNFNTKGRTSFLTFNYSFAD